MKIIESYEAICPSLEMWKGLVLLCATYVIISSPFSDFKGIRVFRANLKRHYMLESNRDLKIEESLQLTTTSTRRYVVLLIGIPGSGKSTLARNILNEINGMPYSTNNWVSISQDAAGSRRQVLMLAEEQLLNGGSVIIDRCNFDRVQRSHWINLSIHYQACCVGIVLHHFGYLPLCIQRAYARGNDGEHADDVDWNFVCRRMERDLVLPALEEGFHRIINLSIVLDGSKQVNTTDLVQCIFSTPFPEQYLRNG